LPVPEYSTTFPRRRKQCPSWADTRSSTTIATVQCLSSLRANHIPM